MKNLLHPLVQTALETHDITYRAIPCDPELADTAAFCEHYGFSLEQSANTIIVASRTNPTTYAACLVLANTKLDVNKKLRQLMNIRKLSFATGEQTIELTDMQIGGVTIIGLPAMPVYVDAAVLKQPEIIIGGGNRSSKIILAPTELTKIPGVQIIESLAIPRA